MSPRTVRIEQGERLTSFIIADPSLRVEEYVKLPGLRHPGSGGGGVDISMPAGPFDTQDGGSSIAFDRRVAETRALSYAGELAEALGAVVIDPPEET